MTGEAREVWVLGAGRFGIRALERLSAGRPATRFTVVDPDEASLARCEGPGRRLILAEGVAYLAGNLRPGEGPDWIVPALPLHLAAEWCLRLLGPGKLQRADVSDAARAFLPHPIWGARGDVYVSQADFLCPDDCPEPRDLCTVTQKPRPRNLFELLAEAPLPGISGVHVLRSRQLGPGAGGYRPRALFSLLDQVRRAGGDPAIATACRCHGVLTAVRRLGG